MTEIDLWPRIKKHIGGKSMSNNFQIVIKKSNDELHVSPSGDLDGSSAWELVNLLDEQYNGRGWVVIDTRNLKQMCPFGCSTFLWGLNQSRLPSDRLSFRGEKGYEIAPEESRVFSYPEEHRCGCNGKCANCQCSKSKDEVK